eukprot:Opistho-2@52962
MEHHVWITRHGERMDSIDEDWEETAERPWDPPLTDRGKEQARLTGVFLRDEGVSHVFSSPFLRCLQTADEIAKVLNVPVMVENGLSEFMTLQWFPKKPIILTSAEIAGAIEKYDGGVYKSQFEFKHPETIRDMGVRYMDTAKRLAQHHPEEGHTLLVTHGYGVQFGVQAFQPSSTIMATPYCCLSKLVKTPTSTDYKIHLLTDAAHWKDVL